MISNKSLALIIGLTGWGLTYLIAKSRSDGLHHEKKQFKKQMTTWEGEGGNLPPPVSYPSRSGLH